MVIKKYYLLVFLVIVTVCVAFGYRYWAETTRVDAGLQEIANGDVQFWLMQGAPNNRFIPCTVYYHFDEPLNETEVLVRLKDLAASYYMFRRNVVEIDGLPYWQSAEPDWNKNFRLLNTNDDIESIRANADEQISQPSELGKGLPLFRVYLSADRKQLIFMWHHVISDYEGMLNKHAQHLFGEQGERTQFGYQMATEGDATSSILSQVRLAAKLVNSDRPLGFTGTDFDVRKIVLPVEDKALYTLGKKSGLAMSDIFSFITLRTVTRYHQSSGDNNDNNDDMIRPVVSPISLRKNSLAIDEGNNRAIRQFPMVFPLERVQDMHDRILALEPSSSSYETAGRVMKIARQLPLLEPALRRLVMPDYISNYFPLADIPLSIDGANLISHDLRVPMVPYERVKFAWSNYDGEVQLYLHTDPTLIDTERMVASYRQASAEVLQYLTDNAAAQMVD